jgi:hypothetical protein
MCFNRYPVASPLRLNHRLVLCEASGFVEKNSAEIAYRVAHVRHPKKPETGRVSCESRNDPDTGRISGRARQLILDY